jgi:hypothetical protein
MSTENDDEVSDESETTADGEAIHENEGGETKEQVMPANMKGFTIVQIIAYIEDEIKKCRKKLEREPSGRVLAYLQGKIPGCKFGLEAMKEIFNLGDDFFEKIEIPVVLNQLSREEILGVEEDMEELKETEEWQKFLSQIQERADSLKNFLLFEAKKSRDLDVSHGKYNGMVMYQKLFDSIKDSAKFWETSLFKREEQNAGTRDANDPRAALLPPGLPAPEDVDYDDAEEAEEIDNLNSEGEDMSDTDNGENDPDVDMGTDGE